ncbi:MAG: hypothetical protein NTW25_15420 [Candidatus Kapabacteria bacterium]|nr:hypothetical protein [Candidatus Kapabacteria bacterium]
MITKSNYYNSLIINLSILILIFPINIFCSNPYINLDKYKIDSIFNKRLERILDTCINKGLFDSILSSKAGYCLISENDSTNYLSNKSIANEIPINKKYYKLLDSIFQNLIDLNLIHNKNYSYRIYEFNKIFKAMEDEREKYYKPIHFKKIYKTITTNEKTQNINKIDSLYLICDYSYNSVIFFTSCYDEG